jgi:hypothetical protein
MSEHAFPFAKSDDGGGLLARDARAQGQKEARFADLRSFGVLDLRPATLTSLNTCRPTSWRICFGGALL